MPIWCLLLSELQYVLPIDAVSLRTPNERRLQCVILLTAKYQHHHGKALLGLCGGCDVSKSHRRQTCHREVK